MELLSFNLNFIAVLQIVVACISIGAGLIILTHRPQEKSARYFTFVCFFIAAWVLCRAFFQLLPPDGPIYFLGILVFIPPIFAAFFLILFSVYIGTENYKFPFAYKAPTFAIFGVLFAISLFPGYVFESFVVQPNGFRDIVYGPYWRMYGPILLFLLFVNFPILFHKYKSAAGPLKLKLRYIIFGLVVSLGITSAVNITLPLFGLTNLVWLGPLSIVFIPISIGYAITRRDLWDFKLILTELVTFLILFVLFLDIFNGFENTETVVFKSATFLFATIFSVLLVRGVIKELESKRRIEAMADQLAVAHRRLREIDAEKSDFVSIATHQLRSPLTLIKGYTSMLLEGSFGTLETIKHKEVIQKIYMASQRLVGMIDDFLNISRIEQGKMKYRFSAFNLNHLITELIEEWQITSKEHKNPILTHFESAHDVFVMGDELKVRQVLDNLIDNAIKYSPKNAPIDIYIELHSEEIVVKIVDAGMGILKEALPSLFKKYSRTEETAKLHTEGRGLGLYIAHKIIKAHNGRMWAESRGQNLGSTFYLSFPRFSTMAPSYKIHEVAVPI